jgi:CBS-domain-containing membrane protein
MERPMKARDIMVAPVITTSPQASVKDVAQLFIKHGISAVPVVDSAGKLVGVISEGDLLRRAEIGTERQHSWWLRAFHGAQELAAEYVKAHSRKVADAMTKRVVTASPDTPVQDMATLMEKHSVKRLPIVESGQLVGIVSRANLVQALASAGSRLEIPLSDTTIRSKLMSHLNAQSWANVDLLNVTVNDGVADVWGLVRSNEERKAVVVAAETSPGVRAVNDHLRTWRLPIEA